MHFRVAWALAMSLALFPSAVNVGAVDLAPCPWSERLRKRVCRPKAATLANKGNSSPIGSRPESQSVVGSGRGELASGPRSTAHASEGLCASQVKQQRADVEVAAAASRGGGGAVRTVHLLYVHVHGHLDHYYHFLHDALLTFFPLYTAFADEAGNPTISTVVLWGRQSFGPFTPIFEAVRNQTLWATASTYYT